MCPIVWLVTTGGSNSANGAATAALMIVILLMSVGLAVATDIATPIRWGISVVSGIVAAGVTYAVVSRR